MRIAHALRQPPERVERALQEVGVDAPYLTRALLEGDPQGAIVAVSARLGVERRELAAAVLRTVAAGGALPPELKDGTFEWRAQVARLPRALRQAALASGFLGLALAGVTALAFLRPDLFRELLVAIAALVLGAVAIALLVGAWRMHRAAAALRRRAR